MLATRIIPVLLNKGGALIKGRQFSHDRVIGHTLQAIRIYQARGVDELIYLDVDAYDSGPDFDLIRQFASECFMPLTIGGGVRTISDIRNLLAAGADKVSINTAAVEATDLITEASEKFGSQAIVVSIDVHDNCVTTHCGKQKQRLDPAEWAQLVEEAGAGEILLNDVERDGCLGGYNTALIARVSGAVSIPVVAVGGAGSYEDLRQALLAGAHAVAASALWAFCDATPAAAAEYLSTQGVAVRRKVIAA